MRKLNTPELLTTGEVARLFKVDRKTVNSWSKAGKLASFRTVGGHRRFHAADIQAFLNSPEGRKP